MPGRSFTSSNYRYGFNGKENDPETSTQDYGMRIYNPGLGKFLSVDPLAGKYPFKTPYDFAENTPILGTDLDGLELNINPSRYLLNAANKSSVGLEKVNTFAKLTNNYHLQVEVGACKSLANGLYFIAAMGGEQNPQVSTSTIPPCGGVASYTRFQIEENKLKRETGPFDADLNKIIDGELSEKTVGAINIGLALYSFTAEEAAVSSSVKYPKLPILKNIEIGTDQATRTASHNTQGLREAHNIFGHTEKGLFKIDDVPMTAKEFYNTMLERGYKPGTDINLYSCNSASNGLAQEISNLSGANIKAPSGWVNPATGGNLSKGTTGVTGSKVVDIKPTNTKK